MELNIKQAYYGVYCSSKEILYNNQRHLFCNMLDLLSRTCKTTEIAGSNINSDQIKFWLIEILPLVLDDELPIQTSAITAFSYFIKALDIAKVQKCSYWPGVKDLVCSFAPRIHKMRDSQNSNWFKTWCILLSVLDKDILKGSSTINSFLSIVELGFRSLNYTVRCEAFLCWRHLIEIFSVHNELCSVKRLKLICIPLKSSQPKSSNVAEIKFRVWWYLISKLQNIEMNFLIVVQPFLGFLFGVNARNIATSEKINDELREMALICIAAIISKSKNDFINDNLNKHELELLPEHFIATSVFEKHWNPILRAVIEALKLCEMKLESDQIILQILTQDTFYNITLSEKSHIYDFFFEELVKLLPYREKPAVQVLNIIAMDNINYRAPKEDQTNDTDVVSAFIKFFIANKASVTKAIMQKCIHNVLGFYFDNNFENIEWMKIVNVFHIILKSNVDEDFKSFEIKLIIWTCVSRYVENIQKLCKDSQMCIEREEALNSWIMWPLKTYTSFQGHLSSFPSCFDLTFCAIWNRLFQSAQNSFEGETFITDVINVFKGILLKKESMPNFPVLFGGFAQFTLKRHFDSDANHQSELFELFNIWITMKKECLNAFLSIFKNIIDDLNSQELETSIEDIKKTLLLVVKPEYKKYISKSLVEDLRRVLVEKLKSCPNKMILSQIKDIFQRSDAFVIIPSVWSLDPDKLTDRQKEKYAQKSEIPALYNDMSQSQESFIKPWTPKKVVIVKEAHNDIFQNKIVDINLENIEKSLPTLLCRSDKSIINQDRIVEDSDTKSKSKNECKQLTKVDEDLLKENNVCMTDDRKRQTILNNFKSLEINTVDGETYDLKTSGQPKRRLSVSECINGGNMKRTYCSSYSLYNSEINEKLRKNDPQSGKACYVLGNRELKVNEKKNSLSMIRTDKTNTSDLEDAYVEKNVFETHLNMSNEESDEVPSTQLKEVKVNNWIVLIDPLKKKKKNDACTIQTEQSEFTQLSIAEQTTTACENSTKVSIGKISFLSSPPDRKITNNSNSPNIKPKTSSRLTGRGAQLINMIRNKRCETSSTLLNPLELNKAISGEFNASSDNVATAICDTISSAFIENTPTHNYNSSNDTLLFSKPLPSPTASPSTSILKRKFPPDVFDDSEMENSVKRKKRVSFHDPPVSITKEFIADEDKINSNLSGCTTLGKSGGVKSSSVKRLLIKNKKIENKDDIGNFSGHEINSSQEVILNSKSFTAQHGCSLKEKQHTKEKSLLETSLKAACDVSVMNKKDIMNYVTEQFTLEDILETFITKDYSLKLKSVNIVLKILTNVMKTSPKIKLRVLENLSENHSKDFLEHAIQENLSSAICERLNLKSIIDFICEKSKVNTLCRNILLAQISEIFTSKLETYHLNFIQNILQTSDLTDENIFYLIQVLVRKRVLGELDVTMSS